MCNLYRMTKNADEVAKWFDAINDAHGRNFGSEVYPGYPGLVVAEGKLQAMSWGFPLSLKGKSGKMLKPKPVNNARTDKLKSFFWRDSFENRRCLIPLTGWAEAQGPKGSMTRTWMSVLGDESAPDGPLFAAAGVWRVSDEWGPVYSMIMTEAAGPAAQVHSRMPVILSPENFATWQTATPQVAFDFCRAWAGPLSIDATDEPWFRKRGT